MLTTVIVPKSGGVTSTKAVVVRWLKREGDSVQLGDPLVELETEIISYELESPAAGILLKVLAGEADEVPVGEPLCHIGDRNDSGAKGSGGSMHLADPANHFPGTSGIIGQSIAHATGAALTAQVKKTGQDSWGTTPPNQFRSLPAANARLEVYFHNIGFRVKVIIGHRRDHRWCSLESQSLRTVQFARKNCRIRFRRSVDPPAYPLVHLSDLDRLPGRP
jgi:pyruvate/2-oxoglutarate dehydrogenase complex dihydrolipoamide acyltransferase (E2) component